MSEIAEKPAKPLGGKAYGSIGHLPQSRLGPGDWHVHDGQARICLEKPRKGDRIVVTEKLDGACMSVANIEGEIVPLTRAGYHAKDATYEHLREFVPYVAVMLPCFKRLLARGERVCGEWLALAHGTRYDASHKRFSPFIPFDLFREGKRVGTDEFMMRVTAADFTPRFCIHDSASPCSIEQALEGLGEHGKHGALEPIEGAVWRIERADAVDFLAKFVRADKIDGKYLPNLSGGEPVWNWRVASNV